MGTDTSKKLDMVNDEQMDEVAGGGYWDEHDFLVTCPHCSKKFIYFGTLDKDIKCEYCGEPILLTQGEGNAHQLSSWA